MIWFVSPCFSGCFRVSSCSRQSDIPLNLFNRGRRQFDRSLFCLPLFFTMITLIIVVKGTMFLCLFCCCSQIKKYILVTFTTTWTQMLVFKIKMMTRNKSFTSSFPFRFFISGVATANHLFSSDPICCFLSHYLYVLVHYVHVSSLVFL